MKELLEKSLQRAIKAMEPEFLGAQRVFLEGLEPGSMRKSTLRLVDS